MSPAGVAPPGGEHAGDAGAAARAAEFDRLVGVLADLHALEDTVGDLAVGPVEFGTAAVAMDLVWAVNEAHAKHVPRLAALREQLEGAIADLVLSEGVPADPSALDAGRSARRTPPGTEVVGNDD